MDKAQQHQTDQHIGVTLNELVERVQRDYGDLPTNEFTSIGQVEYALDFGVKLAGQAEYWESMGVQPIADLFKLSTKQYIERLNDQWIAFAEREGIDTTTAVGKTQVPA